MRILELASIVNFNELEPYSDPSTKKDACIACVLSLSPTNFPTSYFRISAVSSRVPSGKKHWKRRVSVVASIVM